MRNPHPHDQDWHAHQGSYGRQSSYDRQSSYNRKGSSGRTPWWWDPTRPAGTSGRDPDPSSMRVSTMERTEVTNALCRHFGDGRLDEAELEDRLARAAAAKTRADLAPLLTDLPRLDTAAAVVTPDRRPRRHLAWMVLAVIAVLSFGWSVTGWAVGLLRFPFHVPWLLVAIVVVLFLRRGRHHHHYR